MGNQRFPAKHEQLTRNYGVLNKKSWVMARKKSFISSLNNPLCQGGEGIKLKETRTYKCSALKRDETFKLFTKHVG
jgi:hypothetical protein